MRRGKGRKVWLNLLGNDENDALDEEENEWKIVAAFILDLSGKGKLNIWCLSSAGTLKGCNSFKIFDWEGYSDSDGEGMKRRRMVK